MSSACAVRYPWKVSYEKKCRIVALLHDPAIYDRVIQQVAPVRIHRLMVDLQAFDSGLNYSHAWHNVTPHTRHSDRVSTANQSAQHRLCHTHHQRIVGNIPNMPQVEQSFNFSHRSYSFTRRSGRRTFWNRSSAITVSSNRLVVISNRYSRY